MKRKSDKTDGVAHAVLRQGPRRKKRKLNTDISAGGTSTDNAQSGGGVIIASPHNECRLTTAQTVDGVQSLCMCLARSAGNSSWIVAVPGHGVRQIMLGGRGRARAWRCRLIGNDPEGADIDVMIAHLRAHFPCAFEQGSQQD